MVLRIKVKANRLCLACCDDVSWLTLSDCSSARRGERVRERPSRTAHGRAQARSGARVPPSTCGAPRAPRGAGAVWARHPIVTGVNTSARRLGREPRGGDARAHICRICAHHVVLPKMFLSSQVRHTICVRFAARHAMRRRRKGDRTLLQRTELDRPLAPSSGGELCEGGAQLTINRARRWPTASDRVSFIGPLKSPSSL